MHIYIYIYTHYYCCMLCMFVLINYVDMYVCLAHTCRLCMIGAYIYIYIYTQREREREIMYVCLAHISL